MGCVNNHFIFIVAILVPATKFSQRNVVPHFSVTVLSYAALLVPAELTAMPAYFLSTK